MLARLLSLSAIISLSIGVAAKGEQADHLASTMSKLAEATVTSYTVVFEADPISGYEVDTSLRRMPPEFDWPTDEPIVRARIVADAQLVGAGLPSQTLLTSIVTWLSNAFDLPADYHHPHIERTSRFTHVALSSGGFVWSGAVASKYDDAARAIYLSADWRGDTVEGASILVYEMVHHLQNVGGMRYECPQDRERLAYMAQERWLATQQRSLEKSFGIDPTMRLFLTECHIP